MAILERIRGNYKSPQEIIDEQKKQVDIVTESINKTFEELHQLLDSKNNDTEVSVD